MNIKTGLEIFKSMWLIEPQAALSYLQMWEMYMQNPTGRIFRNQEAEGQLKSFDQNLFRSAEIGYAPTDLWSPEAQNFKGFEGKETVVIPVEGPLMKNDYCGFAGTATLSNFVSLAGKTDSVKRVILLIDSPGGTVDGTESFARQIRQVQNSKPVIAFVTGMAASAAYWIASSASAIYASSNTDIIGSIGTMISFYDRSRYLENNGIVLREFYATKSSDKNRAFTEAAKGDGKLLVQSMLDPMNDQFISAVASNRNLPEEVLTGNTYIAKDAAGKGLIDGVLSFESLLSQFKSKKTTQKISMKNFDHIAAIAKVESLYEEEKFFGLTEDQTEAVESAFQLQLQANEQANATIQTLQAERDETLAALSAERANLAAANATIVEQQARIAELEGKDGSQPAGTTREADEKPKPLEKTSIDSWFEQLHNNH